ncbi:hypothetical protein [Sphingomonas sp. Leaf242]|uniref:hypothetical protein n=1 Tax=Sphingomonas sp. Leaf242 TaxID=1736304 RepID=UPI000AFB193C|nr:hypothetical protein [Sphingomonas sp. Leaf242]
MTVQTRIADLVPNPGVLANVVQKTFRTNNALVSSGIATTGPEVDLLMTGGSYIQGLNFINKVDTSTFNYSSDDFDEKGAVGKITAAGYMALRHDLNWGWAYTDLVRLVTKYDVKGGLVSAIPLFWSEVSENLAVASIKGALAKTAALTSGVNTVAFDFDKLIDAAATMDDPRASKTIMLSRKTLAKLQKLNKNAYVPTAETNLGFAQFAGYGLLMTEAFGDDTIVIAQDGAIAFGTGVIGGTTAMEIKRDADAGNGGGGEILRTRLSMVVAPQGFSYTGAAKPGLNGLATAANWTQVADIKDVGFRAIKFLP